MTDKSTVNLVVGFLGLLAAACVGAICLLALRGVAVPDSLNSIASASAGALGAVLASTRSQPAEATEVKGSLNPADAPVQVTEEKP